jgi:hypothetical protein
LQVPVDGLFIERVDLRRSGGRDFLGNRFDGSNVATSEKKPCAFARKGACDSTSDSASGAIDHRNLVFQQHFWFLALRPDLVCKTGAATETHRCLADFFADAGFVTPKTVWVLDWAL